MQLQECVFITSPLIRCIMTLCGFIKSSVNYTVHDQFKKNIDRIFSKIIDISVRRLTSGDYKNTKVSKCAKCFKKISDPGRVRHIFFFLTQPNSRSITKKKTTQDMGGKKEKLKDVKGIKLKNIKEKNKKGQNVEIKKHINNYINNI